MTAGEVLLQVQRLLGEAAGSYYDMRYRLQQINLAQNEMLQDAVGRVSTIQLPVTDDGVFLPDDYLTMGPESPYYVDDRGVHTNLELVAPGWMDRYVREWTDAPRGAPRYLVTDGGSQLRLYPLPTGGEVVVSYVDAADPVRSEDDLVFDGDPSLARYGRGLAFKVAAFELMALNPDLAARYLGLYDGELRRMRHSRRVTPAHGQRMRARFLYARGK